MVLKCKRGRGNGERIIIQIEGKEEIERHFTSLGNDLKKGEKEDRRIKDWAEAPPSRSC